MRSLARWQPDGPSYVAAQQPPENTDRTPLGRSRDGSLTSAAADPEHSGTIPLIPGGLEEGRRQMPDGQPLRIGQSNDETNPTTLQRGVPPFTSFDSEATTEAFVVRSSGPGLLIESNNNGLSVRAENGPVGVDVVTRRGFAVAATTEDSDPDKAALVASANGGPAIQAFGRCEFFKGAKILGDVTVGSRETGETAIHLDATQGDIRLLRADCAEDFDVPGIEEIEPGTVMVINNEGGLEASDQPYDRKVAGVVSGAEGYRPGIILDQQGSRPGRLPMALIGKVYCKVDARFSPIEVGDLLTTSPTRGHAMKATDPLKAFGAVIGKALGTLEAGRGLVPILVALQ